MVPLQIIDAHVHFSNIRAFHETAQSISHVDDTAGGFQADCHRNGVVAGIAMGLSETVPGGFPDTDARTPMPADLDPELPAGLFLCPGINPCDLSRRGGTAIAELADILDDPRTVGVKLYAGYYPFYLDDAVYEPVYRLAAERGLPVVVHGGVTYSARGLLKYAHPLSFDEAIVRHPELTFVICHMGEPWVMDTAALISKSPNVVADLSGLLVTDAATIARKSADPVELLRWRQPLLFEERYDRFLYGSDWPLAPMDAYIAFIRRLIPEAYQGDVFHRNALRVFPRLASAL